MSKNEVIEREVSRRIAGQKVACFEVRDGVQRSEWVGYVSASSPAAYGLISKAKWNNAAFAVRPNGERRSFSVGPVQSTEQAFAEARHWLVASAEIAA